jgi:hypothetical protein
MRLEYREAREVYESIYRRVSDTTWCNVNKIFTEEFPRTQENVVLLAQLKNTMPSIGIYRLPHIKEALKKLKTFTDKGAFLTGKEFKETWIEEGFTLNKNTLSRWFKPLGGFKLDRKYSVEQVKPLLVTLYAKFIAEKIKRGLES